MTIKKEKQVNITFLLGNGFDIGLGLNTRYEDFYDEYSKSKTADNKNIEAFKTMLKSRNLDDQKKIIDWSDFEKAFGEHSSEFTMEKKRDYLERFEDFVENFNKYLEDEEKRADFSNVELIGKTMNTAVSTYFHIRPADRETLQNNHDSVDRYKTYNFISFNYTKCVDECVRIFGQLIKSENTRSVGKVLHIHGFVEDTMIIGVNDATQIENKDFSNDEEVVREIVKPIQNSDSRTNYEKQVISVINSSNIICIYGMSIGDTDKKWWAHIAEWLAKSEKRALVILKHEKKYDKRFPFRQNKLTDAVINRFLELSDQAEEIKTIIRPRIFVGMNHNVFSMKICKKKKLTETSSKQFEAAEKVLSFYNENGDSISEGIRVAEKSQKLANTFAHIK